MKANRFASQRLGNDRAEVGIGTLIVFIAAILAAAVAAAVLITTSSSLQEQGSQTASQAAQQVGSNFQLVAIAASRPATTGDMEHLNITLTVAPGSPAIDLSNTTISLSTATTRKDLSYVNGAGANNRFNASSIRDADSSFSLATPTMNTGDLVTVWINLGSSYNNISLTPGSKLGVRIQPLLGSALVADVQMPPSFGTDRVIEVR